MSDIINEILRMSKEIPKPEITRIIVLPSSIAPTNAVKWLKHGGILWIHETMWEQFCQHISTPPDSVHSISSLFGVPVETYSAEHVELFLEFLRDWSPEAL